MKYIKTIVAGLLLTYINNYSAEKINVKKFTNEQYALHNPFYIAFNNVLYDLSKQKDIVTHSTNSYKLLKNLYIEKLEEGLLTNKRNLDETDLINYTKLKNGPFFRYIEPKIQEAIEQKKNSMNNQHNNISSLEEKRAFTGHKKSNNNLPEVFEISIKLGENSYINYFVKQSLIFQNRIKNVKNVKTVTENLNIIDTINKTNNEKNKLI